MIEYPYESQWGSLACNAPFIEQGISPVEQHDWTRDGYATESEYIFWSRHVCGLACLRSVLRAWYPEEEAPRMGELLAGAAAGAALTLEGGKVGGLFYRPFLAWVKQDFTIEGEVVEGPDLDSMLRRVREGSVFLASVSSEIRYPDRANERRGGHLVLVYRYDGETVHFHNPSGVHDQAAHVQLDIAQFSRFSSGRGMLLRGG